MYKAYFHLLLKRKEFIFSFLFMLTISLGLFLYDCFLQYGADVGEFLSADKLYIGRSCDNPLYLILELILPLVIVLPFSDMALYEKNANMHPVIFARGKQRSYFLSQLFISGISAWLVIFIPFFVNFILCLIAFPLHSVNNTVYGTFAIDNGYYGTWLKNEPFQGLFAVNVYFHSLFYLLLLSLFSALCAMVVYCLSYFLRGNKIFLTFFAFLINNFLIIISDYKDFSVNPYDYLFSLSPIEKYKWYLLILFSVMLFSIIILSPFCKKKLCDLK